MEEGRVVANPWVVVGLTLGGDLNHHYQFLAISFCMITIGRRGCTADVEVGRYSRGVINDQLPSALCVVWLDKVPKLRHRDYCGYSPTIALCWWMVRRKKFNKFCNQCLLAAIMANLITRLMMISSGWDGMGDGLYNEWYRTNKKLVRLKIRV